MFELGLNIPHIVLNMKKIALISLVVALSFLVQVYWWVSEGEVVSAQVVDTEEQKLRERDKGVSDEKLENVRQEVRAIQDRIKKLVEIRYPSSKIESNLFRDPASQGIGRRGQSGFWLSWHMKGKVRVSISLDFVFNEAEAVKTHGVGTNSISMGEFYAAPEFVGKEGVLVKNVQFNQINTNVGLHFVKGRVVVNTYISNFKRKADRNQKDLIEFVQAIEPLINAKTNFDDL